MPPFLKSLAPALLRALSSLLIAALVVAAVSAAARVAPIEALRALVAGAFGSPAAWELTLKRTIPILLTGLSVGWAFRAGLFNIGAEGQLLWGALAAAWVGYGLRLPAPLHLPLSLLAGALAGALWALPAGLLKVTRRVPEVVSTLLLSFIAVELTRLLANGPLHDPIRQGPRTPDIHPTAFLPGLGGQSLHAGLLVALLAAGWLAMVLARGRFGFQLRLVGRGPEAARSAGVSVQRVWLLALVQSGALAGLAGAVEVLGVHHFFQAGFSPGYGYEGIAVAILGGSAPAATVLSALFWGALANGAVELELSTGLSRFVVSIIQALVILVVAVRRWPVPPALVARFSSAR